MAPAMASTEKDLEEQLLEAGNKLVDPPSSVAELLPLLDSQECLEKVAETIRLLTQPGESFLLLLTGEVQRERAAEILGLYSCGFRSQHSSKLGNEFRLFSNYDPGTRLGGWEK